MSNKRHRLFRIGLGVVLLVAAIYLISWFEARGGRGFFSPDTLEAKWQSEILLLGTEIPIYRSSYRFHRYELVDYLISEGYWSPQKTEHPRWISTFWWNEQWHPGQTMLYRELAGSENHWIEWSEEHPDIAEVLWPQVLSELRSDFKHADDRAFYLMYLVRGAESVEEFNERVATDPELKEMR